VNRSSIRIDSRLQYYGGLEIPSTDQIRSTHTSTFLSYSFSSGSWGATIAIPYIYKTQENTFDGSSVLHFHHTNRTAETGTSPSIIESVSSSGLGDVTVLVKVNVYNNVDMDMESGTFTNLFIHGGIKLPTGRIDARDAYGYLLHPHLQNGTGTSTLLIGTNGMFGTFRTSLSGNILCGFPMRSSNNYQEAAALNGDVTLRHRMYPEDPEEGMMLVGNAGFIGRVWGKEEYKQKIVDDSGGYYIFMNTGIAFYPMPTLGVELQYQFPIATNLYGNQLVERYRLTSGISYSL
jgi:hypothetical protein